MAANAYYRQGLTGEGATDLDEILQSALADGDPAFVFTGTTLYVYRYDSTSSAAESSPDVITPRSPTGAGRWILQDINGNGYYQTMQILTADGTYTAPSGLVRAEVIAIGGGGGGGGVDNDGADGAGGGGAGGCAIELLEAATIGASQSVTVGSGGLAGANTGASGGTGESTSFGSLLSATGGTGGGGANGSGNKGTSGAGGTASGGDINIQGGDGNVGHLYGGGLGGASYLAGGGAGGHNSNGNDGKDYGSGGGGGGDDDGPGYTGGAGGDGVIIVREFY